jgi:cholesterol transport system auxiliary component
MKNNTHLTVSLCRYRLGAAGLCLIVITGCAALRPDDPAGALNMYSLSAAHDAMAMKEGGTPAASATAATLLVSVPRAVAGFDSKRIIYLRQAHKLEYFADSQWVDTPARMLSPRIVAILEKRGAFRAVVHSPGSASGDLRLDTEIVLLQQEFDGLPSRVRFVLRSSLVEDASRHVIATREFEAVVNATSDDPYGGVLAANQAVDAILNELADFCADAAEVWRRERAAAS